MTDRARPTYEFDADLWLWQARTDSWTFVSLPTDLADDVLDRAGPTVRGFGAVRVAVTIGRTSWRTSLFPDSKAGTYVLPVKRAVRTAEGLTVGDTAHVRLELVDAPQAPAGPAAASYSPIAATLAADADDGSNR